MTCIANLLQSSTGMFHVLRAVAVTIGWPDAPPWSGRVHGRRTVTKTLAWPQREMADMSNAEVYVPSCPVALFRWLPSIRETARTR